MDIKSAEFVMSNSDVKRCPAGGLPEYAFIGRSNVGKSSLINMLARKKGLAMTSSTPGKTLLINHFLINKEWYMVDLPGYGFAKRSKTQQQEIERMIVDYVLTREQMVNLFVLIDCRHEPQQIDLEFLQWLGEKEVPFSIIFTKGDKLGVTQLRQNVEAYKQKLGEWWEELPPCFVTSSQKAQGRDELLDYIASVNKTL